MTTPALESRRPIPAKRQTSLRSAAGLVAMLLVGLSVGCQTGDFAYVATIAGGEKVRIPLEKGGAVLSKEGSVQIIHAVGDVEPAKKQFFYKFAFTDKSGAEVRRVLVEDVSDEQALTLVEDVSPKLTDQRWDAVPRYFGGDDPAAKWIFYVGDSFRVFRFTITYADGRKVVLHQGSRVPGWAKVSIRAMFGEKY